MNEENRPEPEDEGPMDEGPIVLPAGANCTTCAYAIQITVEVPARIQGSTKKESRLFCRRNPPTAMLIPTGPQSAGLSAQFPPVDENTVCFEYDVAMTGLLANG